MCASVADESRSMDGLGLDGLCWDGMGCWGYCWHQSPGQQWDLAVPITPLSVALCNVPCLARAVLLLFTRWHCFLV